MAVELDARHALVKLDSKLIQCGFPIPNRHRPFLADVIQGQIEQLEHFVVGWERSSGLGDVAQTHVDGLDGVGRVNHLANVRREFKERDQARPVSPPRLADRCE